MTRKAKCNRQGTPLGPRGYVQCQAEGCGREVPEISKDTGPAYARCRIHNLDPRTVAREAQRQAFFQAKRNKVEEG